MTRLASHSRWQSRFLFQRSGHVTWSCDTHWLRLVLPEAVGTQRGSCTVHTWAAAAAAAAADNDSWRRRCQRSPSAPQNTCAFLPTTATNWGAENQSLLQCMAMILRKNQLKSAHEYQICVPICSNYFDAVNCQTAHIIDIISHKQGFFI